MIHGKTKILFFTFSTILGTGVVAFIFWQSSQYRAATPLVFISGLVLLAVGIGRGTFRLVHSSSLVRQLKQRVQSLSEQKLWRRHTPQLVTNLYFTHLRQYPEWIRESRDYIPSSVTTAGRTPEGVEQILLYYAQYNFSFKEAPLEEGLPPTGTLSIVREGAPILTLQIIQETDKKGVQSWRPIAISSYSLDSRWIREFENLKAEILAIIKDRAREARES